MPKVTLTFASGRYDRTQSLIDGTITPDGFSLAPVVLPPSELFRRAFREGAFEIAELSASTQAIQVARGENKYVALPAFLSRAFRHNSIYIRTDRGINAAGDLAGKTIGVPEYQMTLAVWVRGILADFYGVPTSSMRYRTGGIDKPGRTERIAINLPSSIDCQSIAAGKTLSGMLEDGEIDAVFSPRPPACFVAGTTNVARLFSDPAAEEARYFASTGIFPIMHLVGIRKDIAAAHPDLPVSLYKALCAARTEAHARLADMARAPAIPLMLPWLEAEWSRTRAAMGADFWPYGVEQNSATLDALCAYLHAQHLTSRRLAPEELFILQQ